MALTNARMKAVIDAELATVTHIGFSTNGATETGIVARMAVPGGWTTPAAANPYEPSNASAGESAAASGGGTITHYAGFTASSGGTQITEWIPVTDPDPVLIAGGKLSIAANALKPVKGARS